MRMTLNFKLSALATATFLSLLTACGGGSGSDTTESSVTIRRDSMGVPHVKGDSAESTMYGAGYAAAEDRLFQLEFMRRTANGTLAEILGASVVNLDREARQTGYTDAEARAMLSALPEEHQRLFRANLRGVNAYIAKAIEEPKRFMPIEYQTYGIQPKPFSEEDAVRVVVLTVRNYGGSGGQELNNLAFLEEMTARYGSGKAQQIFDDIVVLNDPDADTIVRRPAAAGTLVAQVHKKDVKSARGRIGPIADSMRETQIARTQLLDSLGFSRGASRSLTIGPKRSADGKVMMLQSTADGYDMHMSGGGFDTAGLVIGFGAPVMGRGVQHGWLITTGESDTKDIMEHQVNPSNPRQYRYKGEWREFTARQEVINVRGGAAVSMEVLRSVHGPVVATDVQRNRVYALRNTTEGKEMEGFRAVLDLGRAGSLQEFRAALRGLPQNLNVSYGGEDGHIEIWHAGLQPVRAKGVDPRLPTPGDGSADWQGFVPMENWVNEANPAAGYFFAWNNKPAPESTYGDTSRYGKHFRVWLAHEQVAARPKISYSDMKDINRALAHGYGGVDLSSTTPAFFAKYLREAVANDPNVRRKEAVDRMLAWNGIREDNDDNGAYDSPGLALFEKWRAVALQSVFADDIGDWPEKLDAPIYIKYRTSLLLRALQGTDAGKPMAIDYLNGRSRGEVIRESLDATLLALDKQFGSQDMATWKQDVPYRTFGVSGLMGSVAVSLGKIPERIRQNGNENWNALMRIDAAKSPMETLIPTGGQSRFISVDGTASPHISDQVERHRLLNFKTIALSDKDVQDAARGNSTVLTYKP